MDSREIKRCLLDTNEGSKIAAINTIGIAYCNEFDMPDDVKKADSIINELFDNDKTVELGIAVLIIILEEFDEENIFDPQSSFQLTIVRHLQALLQFKPDIFHMMVDLIHEKKENKIDFILFLENIFKDMTYDLDEADLRRIFGGLSLIIDDVIQKCEGENEKETLEGVLRIIHEYDESAVHVRVDVFNDESTDDPAEAVNILVNRALNKLPVLSYEQYQEEYHRFRNAWGNLPLVEGSKDDIGKLLLKNAKELAGRNDFQNFAIKLYLADLGYKDKEVAAFEAWIEGKGFIVMLWKTKKNIHAFGRPELLT